MLHIYLFCVLAWKLSILFLFGDSILIYELVSASTFTSPSFTEHHNKFIHSSNIRHRACRDGWWFKKKCIHSPSLIDSMIWRSLESNGKWGLVSHLVVNSHTRFTLFLDTLHFLRISQILTYTINARLFTNMKKNKIIRGFGLPPKQRLRKHRGTTQAID